MSITRLRLLTGILLILTPIAFNVFFTMLPLVCLWEVCRPDRVR